MFKKPTRLQRVINAFKQEFHATCVEHTGELRVSDLPKAEQDEFWRRDGELHPSGFPFCGLRAAYERFVRDDDPIVYESFGSDYYLNAGTVMHSAFQRWFGKKGRLIGDWECVRCKRVCKFNVRPKKCPCGCPEFKYNELGALEGKLSWHTDGLFMYGSHEDPEYWLVDLKSTSMWALEKHERGQASDLPYKKNIFQIESYTRLVEKKHKIKIAGWLLVYVPRDKPNQSWRIGIFGKELNDERREELDARLETAIQDFNHVLHVRTHPVKVFKRVLPTKICPDRDFYNEFIASPFDECPLQEVCFNRKRLLATLKETIESCE